MGGEAVAGWTAADLGSASLASSGPAILVGVLAAAAIALIFVGLQRVVNGRTNAIGARLDDLNIRGYMPDPSLATAKKRRRRAANIAASRLDGATSSSLALRIGRDLAQADVKITVGEFMLLSVVLASVGALIGIAAPLGGRVLLSLLLLLVGLLGPWIYVRRAKLARQAAFSAQLADMIGLMVGALRSGFALMQSLELASREGPAPSSVEFDRVVREIGLGLSPEEALNNLVERMQSDDLDLLVTALNVQREVGGNLVEVLETIAHTIRDRQKLFGEIKVLTSQQQLSGYIIALLPVGISLVLVLINPTYMLGVFSTTLWCGWAMLCSSAVMITLGFIIMRRIVNIRV